MAALDRMTIALMLLIVLAVTNLTAFLLMRSDKRRAQRGARRIPERILFIAVALFGGLGGVLGMRVFRHKTKHVVFQVGFPLLMIVQVVLVALGGVLLFLR